MPRWPRGLHPYAGGQRAVATPPRLPASVGLEQYTGIQRGVPINDGQGQQIVPGSGTVSVIIGPQGLGTVWYPAAVTVSTTTGVLDTSVCQIFAGPAGLNTPTTLLGTIPSGGAGVLAAAVPPLPVGWYLTAVWTGAHPGDVAAINVTGSKDARVTG